MIRWSRQKLPPLWRATDFPHQGVLVYSNKLILQDTRTGVIAMSILAALLLASEALLYQQLNFSQSYYYTCSLLVVLALHIAFAARAVNKINDLYLLAMTILIVSGTAFILLAQQSGRFSSVLFASVALLIMVIPMVPWGLREASGVMALIYATFTISTWGMSSKFSSESLWTLQFIMAGAGIISLALVARNVIVRKRDIYARYELQEAHNKILTLSNKDPLTGVWNRRYLGDQFEILRQRWHRAGYNCSFSFVDIDDFKQLNDHYGHDFGDQILIWLSRAMVETIADNGIVVRMGGDEFAIYSHLDDLPFLLRTISEKVRNQIKQDNRIEESSFSISVGIAQQPSANLVLQQTLCKLADEALYQAKTMKTNSTATVHLVSLIMNNEACNG